MTTTALKSIVRNGRVEAEAPDWAEGTEVTIEPIHQEYPSELIIGMTEDEQGDDPEPIARWIAEFEAIPILVMSAKEEADMLEWRKMVKDYNVDAVRRQIECLNGSA